MPIIFEHRLGNSESDKKLRKIYGLHNIFWTLYYAFFIAILGCGIAILASAQGNPIFAILIAAVTVVMLIVFLKRQVGRGRRR